MKDYRKIHAWHRSHKLVLQVYELTETFPAKEMYGLCSQLRRSAVSIPTNIAEGCGRTTGTELTRFVDISLGSLNEVEYLLFFEHRTQVCRGKGLFADFCGSCGNQKNAYSFCTDYSQEQRVANCQRAVESLAGIRLLDTGI
ncbi:MAG: four helix bundle protein [Anaerohalosphaeraceae bacterium]